MGIYLSRKRIDGSEIYETIDIADVNDIVPLLKEQMTGPGKTWVLDVFDEDEEKIHQIRKVFSEQINYYEETSFKNHYEFTLLPVPKSKRRFSTPNKKTNYSYLKSYMTCHNRFLKRISKNYTIDDGVIAVENVLGNESIFFSVTMHDNKDIITISKLINPKELVVIKNSDVEKSTNYEKLQKVSSIFLTELKKTKTYIERYKNESK